MRIAILGGGLAGIEVARRLDELRIAHVVFEKESTIGGLCRTNRTGPYHWDFGVHALYSRSAEVMGYLNSLPLPFVPSSRMVRVFHTRGKRHYLLDYPFEFGIRDLPPFQRAECVAGYLAARLARHPIPDDLASWIPLFLGRGIGRHFMVPYNTKIWNCPLHLISSSIVTTKIEPEPVLKFLASALGRKTVGREYQARFIYPENGLQEMVDCLARPVAANVRLNARVSGLERKGGKWMVHADGESEGFDSVVSTMPLVELLKMVTVQGLAKAYENLRWNDTFFVMVGLREGRRFRSIDDCHWVFFKGEEVFYRITLMHNFSPALPPALVAEITCKGTAGDGAELAARVVSDLLRLGIIASGDDIARTDVKLQRHTYPIQTIGLDATKRSIAALLERDGIHLFGRSGNWDYINIDGVILKAAEFVPALVKGLAGI